MSQFEMKKVETLPDFIQLEHQMLKFWASNQIFNKLRQKNAAGEIFRFLDGPITANNPMGVHHARGRTLKDTFLRYKSLRGYTSHYQNGFDGQGLWVEVEVERELGFNSKEDIIAYGIKEFIQRCKERVEKYSAIQTEQSVRLGQWMDWPNSYYTHHDSNIEGIWYFLGKCHHNGWLYKSHRPMRWCPRCGTSLSEHEMIGSYRDIVHVSVYALAPSKSQEFSFLVWTTTPWTLAGNTALAVKPESDYSIVQVAGWTSPIVLVNTQLEALRSKEANILRTVKGKELVGIEYETFFPDLSIQSNVDHRVVPWDDIDTETGTGIVHIAPACGIEDFQLSEITDIDVLPIVDETGKFLPELDDLSGEKTDAVSDTITERLEAQGKLYRKEEFEHSFPVCWRCKTETIFRLVDEWNISTDEIRPRLLEATDSIVWQPDYAGKVMSDWLENMGDWSISRKRFYGLPLPIYPCQTCSEVTVVESKADLSALSGVSIDDLPELHRPYIDEISIKCPKCGTENVRRIPEVGDVWLDAGIVPYTTLGYFNDKTQWEKYFPAEWITEMREQIRLWFYSMLFMSVTISGRAPYERVSTYESVLSETGTRFSKSGYMIHFDEAAEKIGADVMRYLYMSTRNSSNVLFGYNLADEVRRKLLQLWNTYNFFVTYARIDQPDIQGYTLNEDNLLPIDQWMLARIHQFIVESEMAYEAYDTCGVITAFDSYLGDLSNGYVRFNRRRIWKSENDRDKQTCYWVMFEAIVVVLKVMSPILPFITDTIWQNLVRPLKPDSPESIHLSGWPSIEDKFAHDELLDSFSVTRRVIGLSQQLRERFSLKTRQPLKTVFITASSGVHQAVDLFESIIMSEANVHEIQIVKDRTELEQPYLILDFGKAGPVLRDSTHKLMKILSNLPSEEMAKSVAMFESEDENITVKGYNTPLSSSYFIKKYKPMDGVVLASDDDISVGLDNKLTDDLIQEGLIRDLIRHIQVFRKDSNLEVDDQIHLRLDTTSEILTKAIRSHSDYIQQETLALHLEFTAEASEHERTINIDEHEVTIGITIDNQQ